MLVCTEWHALRTHVRTHMRAHTHTIARTSAKDSGIVCKEMLRHVPLGHTQGQLNITTSKQAYFKPPSEHSLTSFSFLLAFCASRRFFFFLNQTAIISHINVIPYTSVFSVCLVGVGSEENWWCSFPCFFMGWQNGARDPRDDIMLAVPIWGHGQFAGWWYATIWFAC